jgi:flagellar hook-associated protein 3 FlgL
VAGPPVAYVGNANPLQVNLGPDTQFGVSVTGNVLLNARSTEGGETDLFQNLSNLQDAMRGGNNAGMAAGLANLDADLDNVVRVRGDMGARVQYLQLAQDRLGTDLAEARGYQSHLENADLAASAIEAASAELAHEAALAVAAKTGSPSLLDYLR